MKNILKLCEVLEKSENGKKYILLDNFAAKRKNRVEPLGGT
jgi:hypothetical protein